MAPALASYFPVSAWLLVPSALPVTGSAISAGSLLLLEVNPPTPATYSVAWVSPCFSASFPFASVGKPRSHSRFRDLLMTVQMSISNEYKPKDKLSDLGKSSKFGFQTCLLPDMKAESLTAIFYFLKFIFNWKVIA